MPFIVQTEDGSTINVHTSISVADDYKSYYANGAQGGILATYHFRVDFYQDIIPPLKGREVAGKVDIESAFEGGVNRKIQTSVYMSLAFAKELAAWMTKQISDHESAYGPIQMGGAPRQEMSPSATNSDVVKALNDSTGRDSKRQVATPETKSKPPKAGK